MAVTLEQAKALRPGDTLYHVENRNADHTPQRWRVTGRVKVWKTRPNEVRVPVKNGLRNYGYVTENELGLVTLNPNELD